MSRIPHYVPQTYTQVVPDASIYPDFFIRYCVVRQNDADRLLPPFALHENRVAPEKLELIHLVLHHINSASHAAAAKKL